jgi:hypothetical protein
MLDLVQDDSPLEQRILQRFRKNVDDPPLLFDWVDPNLEAFWIKAVGYGAVRISRRFGSRLWGMVPS